MSEFLLTLLGLLLGLGTILTPTLPQKAVDNIEEHTSSVNSPEEKALEQIDEIIISDENTPDFVETNNHEENSSNSEKVNAYNTQSEKPVGEVAAVAVEKAEPLIPAVIADPEPTVEPSPTPTPTPIDPPVVEPIDPPIVIDPPVPPYPCDPYEPHLMYSDGIERPSKMPCIYSLE